MFFAAVCPNLVLPVNLLADGAGILDGTRVSFRCVEGWHVEGATTITCLTARQWSDPVPTCAQGGMYRLGIVGFTGQEASQNNI